MWCLIDALISSDSFGDVKLIEPDELEDCDGLTSCHGFGVAEALGLAGSIGSSAQQTLIDWHSYSI